MSGKNQRKKVKIKTGNRQLAYKLHSLANEEIAIVEGNYKL